MSMSHTLSTPAPAPRWLLLGSLALNLFLIGLTAALVMREPGSSDRSVAGRMERLAAALPAVDGDKLRTEFTANRTAAEGARARYDEAREGISTALKREPYDDAAVRDAMAKTRAARQELEIVLQSIVAKAAADMSVSGRTAMADWRPSRSGR